MAATAGLSALVMTAWATASDIWVRPARDRPVARSGLTPSVIARPATGVPIAHAQPAAPGRTARYPICPNLGRSPQWPPARSPDQSSQRRHHARERRPAQCCTRKCPCTSCHTMCRGPTPGGAAMPAISADTVALPRIPTVDPTAADRPVVSVTTAPSGPGRRGLPRPPRLRRRRPGNPRPVRAHGPDG